MNFLLEPGFAIYMAMGVALVVWIAVFLYLLRLDRQAQELRRLLESSEPQTEQPAPRATLEARHPGSAGD